jgi:hypothetical protein
MLNWISKTDSSRMMNFAFPNVFSLLQFEHQGTFDYEWYLGEGSIDRLWTLQYIVCIGWRIEALHKCFHCMLYFVDLQIYIE